MRVRIRDGLVIVDVDYQFSTAKVLMSTIMWADMRRDNSILDVTRMLGPWWEKADRFVRRIEGRAFTTPEHRVRVPRCPQCGETALDFRGSDSDPTYYICPQQHEWKVPRVCAWCYNENCTIDHRRSA